MKTLGRTFIILIAAGLIALGWYTYSTIATSQTMEPPDRPAEFAQMDEATAAQPSTTEASQAPPARLEGGEMGFSLSQVLTGMVANVGITALVIGLVVLFRRLTNRFTLIPFRLVWFRR